MSGNRTLPASDHESAPAVRCRGVGVTLGGVDVLSGVDLDVESGDFVGIVGPNGAGKTTLLRTVAGTLSPDDGTVEIYGDDVHRLSSREASRRVAVVPQDTTLSFSFDVETVVEMGRTPYRSRFSTPDADDRETVERALRRTGIEDLTDRDVTTLSGGERQRVVVARALAQATPVLLLDEPTASLDVNHQVETLSLVRSLAADGKAVVAAIHDLSLAARFCDRLAVIHEGGILAAGTPEQVLSRDVVRTAFDTDAVVDRDPTTGTPTVTALPSANPGAEPRGAPGGTAPADDTHHVHVVGGGPVTSTVLTRLRSAGHAVTAGPLPSGDVAAEAARRLAVDVDTLPPHEPVDDDALATLGDRVDAAAVTVVVDLTLTAGNQRVLDVLASADDPVVVEETPVEDRNRAGTAARESYERLLESAVATPLADLERAVRPGGRTATHDDKPS